MRGKHGSANNKSKNKPDKGQWAQCMGNFSAAKRGKISLGA